MGDELCCHNVTCWGDVITPLSARLRLLLGPTAIIYENDCGSSIVGPNSSSPSLGRIAPELTHVSVDLYDGCNSPTTDTHTDTPTYTHTHTCTSASNQQPPRSSPPKSGHRSTTVPPRVGGLLAGCCAVDGIATDRTRTPDQPSRFLGRLGRTPVFPPLFLLQTGRSRGGCRVRTAG